jgi:hypothetical protein
MSGLIEWSDAHGSEGVHIDTIACMQVTSHEDWIFEPTINLDGERNL